METTDIKQMVPLLEDLLDKSVQFGIKLVTAVAILVIGLWVVKRLTISLRKIMTLRQVDPSLLSFLASLVNIVLKILVVIVVLTTVGIEMTSIVAVLGAASLAIGMALSGTLQNFAGGVVILLFKPFKVGDYIEVQTGYAGSVQEILIFTTRLKTVDNKVVYLPNGNLANGVITNYNQEGLRRIDCTFDIAYGDDVATARQVLMELMKHDARIHKTPPPQVYLQTLSESSIRLMVRFWVSTEHILAVQYDLNEQVYFQFTRHGLHFPFPQVAVHLEKKNDAAV